MPVRRTVIVAALGLAALPWAARAQDFPQRGPIRLIIGAPVASATDLVGRLLADALDPVLGQRIVVLNKPTANGALAGAEIARAPADGYALLLTVTSSMVVNPHLNRHVTWHPVQDFTAIGEIGTTASVMAVGADSPLRRFADLTAQAKARPGQVKVGVLTLALSHFIALALKDRLGVDLAIIPFSNQAQLVAAAVSGDVDAISTGAGSLLQFFNSGRLRPLVVSSDARMAELPDVPALSESVPDFSVPNWFGLFGPPAMDPKLVARLNRALNDVLAQPRVRAQLATYGTQPTGGAPDAMARLVKSDFERYRGIVAKAGLAP